MSFPKYDRYKESGVEWLGEVPEHWSVGHIKRLTTKITDGAHISPETENGVYAFISTKDVRDDSLDFENCLRTSVENYEYLVRTGCKPMTGDVLFSKDGTIGRTVVIKEDRDFVVASSLIIITPDKKILSPIFLNYLYQSSTIMSQVECFVKGAGLPRLSIQNLLRIIGVFPPLPEQQSIATFLDRETAKIDELIAEQQRLIDLLKEKRQAVISHAVTKGLNPDAPMKETAIEWLGEVPEGWIRTPIKYALTALIDTEHKTAPFYEDGEYLVVRTTNIKDGKLTLDGAKYTDLNGYIEWTSRGEPHPGDIMFTREAPAGEACLVPGALSLCMGQRTVLMKIDHDILESRFGLWSLYGGLSSDFISQLSQGSTVVHFNMRDIGNIPIMLPIYSEQKEVADFLDRATTEIDELIAEAQHAIALLQERRTALISAAVTGKIDIRGFV